MSLMNQKDKREILPFLEKLDPNTEDTNYTLELSWKGAIQKYELVKRYVGSEDVVLDAGCGYGWGAAEIAAIANKVIGIDSDAPSVETAKERYKKLNLEFIVGNIENMRFEGSSFTLVSCIEVIEHMSIPIDALEAINHVLAPEGILVLTTPNGRNTMREGIPGHDYHIKEYTIEEMYKMLSETGFKVEHTFGQYIPFGFFMKFLGNKINHSSNPEYGDLQKILNTIPIVPDVCSRFYPHLVSTSKSVGYIARKI